MNIETAVRIDWVPSSDEFTIQPLDESLKDHNGGYSVYSLLNPPVLIHLFWFPSFPPDEKRNAMQENIVMFVLEKLEALGIH